MDLNLLRGISFPLKPRRMNLQSGQEERRTANIRTTKYQVRFNAPKRDNTCPEMTQTVENIIHPPVSANAADANVRFDFGESVFIN